MAANKHENLTGGTNTSTIPYTMRGFDVIVNLTSR